MTRLTLLGAASLAGLMALGGCAPRQAAPRTKADAGAIAACRARTEAAYNRQNRYLLSERDTSASPFSTSGNTGITTQGLSQRYGLDTAMANCLGGTNGPVDAGTGGAFSPAGTATLGNPTQ